MYEQSVKENVYLAMQFIILLVIQLLATAGPLLSANDQPKNFVTVIVTDIGGQKGEIMAALFASEKSFPNDSKAAFKVAKTPAAGGKAVLQFEQVPPGKYAIALFHDVNGDGKLNTNVIGIPKEGYGVSNNVKNLFSGPSFRQSAFEHRNNTTLTITMRY